MLMKYNCNLYDIVYIWINLTCYDTVKWKEGIVLIKFAFTAIMHQNYCLKLCMWRVFYWWLPVGRIYHEWWWQFWRNCNYIMIYTPDLSLVVQTDDIVSNLLHFLRVLYAKTLPCFYGKSSLQFFRQIFQILACLILCVLDLPNPWRTTSFDLQLHLANDGLNNLA